MRANKMNQIKDLLTPKYIKIWAKQSNKVLKDTPFGQVEILEPDNTNPYLFSEIRSNKDAEFTVHTEVQAEKMKRFFLTE